MGDYSAKTRNELIAICKERGLKGYSTKKKDELLTLLSTSVTTTSQNISKPFLKWVGGKTQILTEVLAQFPSQIHNYFEPFLGGGSVLLGLLSYIKANKIKVAGKIYASDLNPNIIALFKNIQTNPQGLIDEINNLIAEYSSCTGTAVNRKPKNKEEALTSQESYYYWIRSQFNLLPKETINSSAMMLFLNKTCFRGVYREGPNGFNVPFGNYNNPSIIDEQHIREVSELIKDVVFKQASFTDALQPAKNGDFVYLDPPYAPETEKSFVSYTADGFKLEDHKALFELCNNLSNNNVKLVMSNADVKLLKESFPEPKYQTKIIVARRAINSKNPESKTNEVLIMN
jgi:DNA adenine methylase